MGALPHQWRVPLRSHTKDLGPLVALSEARSNGHMADARSTWNDAGERFQVLGASLKQHYRQQRGDEADRDKGQAADAFTKAGDALQAAFDTLATAASDPTVKHEVKQASISVADALAATFAEVSDDLRRAFESAPPAAEPGAAEQSPQDRKEPGAST